MKPNYSLLAKKPLISWDELVLLLFGREYIQPEFGYYRKDDHETVKAQKDFKTWFEEAFKVGELNGNITYKHKYKKVAQNITAFVGNKSDVFRWVVDNDVIDWLKENKVEVPEESKDLINKAHLSYTSVKEESSDTSVQQTKEARQATKDVGHPSASKPISGKGSHGRSDPTGKIQKAIQKLKEAGVPQSVIPYKPEILKLLPNECDCIERGTKDPKYKKETGRALSTIKTLAREIYKN